MAAMTPISGAAHHISTMAVRTSATLVSRAAESVGRKRWSMTMTASFSGAASMVRQARPLTFTAPVRDDRTAIDHRRIARLAR